MFPTLVFWINTFKRPQNALANANKILNSFSILKHVKIVIAHTEADQEYFNNCSLEVRKTFIFKKFDDKGYDLNNLRMYEWLSSQSNTYALNCSDRYIYDFDGDKLYKSVKEAFDKASLAVIPLSILKRRSIIVEEPLDNIDTYCLSTLAANLSLNRLSINKNTLYVQPKDSKKAIDWILKSGFIDSIGDIIVSGSCLSELMLMSKNFDGTFMLPVFIQLKILSSIALRNEAVSIYLDTLVGRFHSVTKSTNKSTRHDWNKVVLGNYTLSWCIPQLRQDKRIIKRLSVACATSDKNNKLININECAYLCAGYNQCSLSYNFYRLFFLILYLLRREYKALSFYKNRC